MHSIDGPIRLNMIHCPDRAGMTPAQPMDQPLMLVLPDASKATQNVFQFTARHGGEGGLQRRYPDTGSGETEQLHDLIAQGAGRTTGGTSPGVWLEAVLAKPLTPMTQGAGRQTQTAHRFRTLDALLRRPVAEVEDHAAGLMLGLTAWLLTGRTTSAR